MRSAVAAAGLGIVVHVVNEAGLAVYASSELARSELPEFGVPQRRATSLARRLQDPLSEIVKVDPRHLGLGSEQGLVSKANLRRMIDETVESCTLLTTRPNSLVESVGHNRMPVLLSSDTEYRTWLSPENGRGAVEHMFAPTDPALMVKRVAEK